MIKNCSILLIVATSAFLSACGGGAVEEESTQPDTTVTEAPQSDGINGVWYLGEGDEYTEYRVINDNGKEILEYGIEGGVCAYSCNATYEHVDGNTYREYDGDGYYTTFTLESNGSTITYKGISETEDGVTTPLDIETSFPLANVSADYLLDLCLQ